MSRAVVMAMFWWVITASSTTVEAQTFTYPSDLARWFVTEKPLPEALADAQGDFTTDWVIIPGGESPRVHLMGRKAVEPAPLPFEIEPMEGGRHLGGDRESIRVDDGWVVSFDHGEFGGEIWWFSPDGRRRTLFSRENLVEFLPTGNGIYLATGLVHGFDDGGRIEKLVRGKDGQWSSQFLLYLATAPQAATVEAGGTLLIVTNKQVVRFDPTSSKLDVLFDDAPWGGLYPNSVAITPKGRVFVGMRHGVARIETKGTATSMDWLLPNKNFDVQMRRVGFH